MPRGISSRRSTTRAPWSKSPFWFGGLVWEDLVFGFPALLYAFSLWGRIKCLLLLILAYIHNHFVLLFWDEFTTFNTGILFLFHLFLVRVELTDSFLLLCTFTFIALCFGLVWIFTFQYFLSHFSFCSPVDVPDLHFFLPSCRIKWFPFSVSLCVISSSLSYCFGSVW